MKMFQINSMKYQDLDTKPKVAPKARKHLKANFIIKIQRQKKLWLSQIHQCIKKQYMIPKFNLL